jgi:site-specific recombinase XerD
MKIEQAVATYVGYKQSLGMRFATQARMLNSFSKSMGSIEVDRIGPESARAFLDGNGPMTRNWHCKFGTLKGFYRFCLARGYVSSVPLPTTEPRCPQTFTPYIYSEDEIKRLLQAAASRVSCRIDALTSRTMLLLLYAAGLRISEALNLNLADVDLIDRVLYIRRSKFYKTRLVHIGTDLTKVLREYTQQRYKRSPLDPEAPFLVTSSGKRILRAGAEQAFGWMRSQAKVHRHDGGRYQPRLHDLRHTAAVTRLVSWYREGVDVQRLLPHLATYLGHVHISGTQCYLSMTPELLQQACGRFEQFVLGESSHA